MGVVLLALRGIKHPLPYHVATASWGRYRAGGRQVGRGVKQWALTYVYVPEHPCEVTPESPKYAKLLLGWAPGSPHCWAQTPSRVAL